MKRNEFGRKLQRYIDAYYSVIYVNTYDNKVVDEALKKIGKGRRVYEYVDGIGTVDYKNNSVQKNMDLIAFLNLVRDDGYDAEDEGSVVIVLKDIHYKLEDINVIAQLKYIIERHQNIDSYEASIVIVSSKMVIPDELEKYITIVDVDLPSQEEIFDIIQDFRNVNDFEADVDFLNEMALSMKGLSEVQVNQILYFACQDEGKIDEDDKKLIAEQKAQLIKKSGLLEIVDVDENIAIGGLEVLKEWLKRKAYIYDQLDKAAKAGVDTPKGMMVVGMPGCGKSLTAKATSILFKMPLVKLDIGRLFGKYVGESEENMRKALKLAEAISPCVMWVDELEKAFAGVGGQGGASDVTTRLFGQFLTWMQENKSAVFVVATANDISNIPPEFLRKGRFDEVFYVGFPNAKEREEIFKIHLRKRGKFNADIKLAPVVNATEGYCGADIEAIVKEAAEKAFYEKKKKLTTEDLTEAQKLVPSISKTLKKKIENINKAIEDMQIKTASI